MVLLPVEGGGRQTWGLVLHAETYLLTYLPTCLLTHLPTYLPTYLITCQA